MSEFETFFRNLDTRRAQRPTAPHHGRKTKLFRPALRGWEMRGYREARGKRLKGEPGVWRGPTLATRQDGATRSLQVLRAMASQPRAWWARFDLRDATGMPYNSLKAIVAKLERRGWVQRREVSEGLSARRNPRHNREVIGRAAVRFRITAVGARLVAMCE